MLDIRICKIKLRTIGKDLKKNEKDTPKIIKVVFNRLNIYVILKELVLDNNLEKHLEMVFIKECMDSPNQM